MSYHWSFGRAMSDVLEISADSEELKRDFKNNEFVATTGRALSISLAIASPISAIVGLLITFLLTAEERAIGILFIVLGACGLLLLPTLFSWRCTVNKDVILEEYYVLFIKCKKKVYWNDVKYQKVVLDSNRKIVLYDCNKKQLISFDGTTVGFNQILKMAKRKGIVKIKK